MARQVDPRNKLPNDVGSNHGSYLRAMSQQFYSATTKGQPSGPRQRPSGYQQRDGLVKKNVGNDSISKDFTKNEAAEFRKRTVNVKNVDIRRVDMVRDNRQTVRPDAVFDAGKGMPMRSEVRDVQGVCEKERTDENAFVQNDKRLTIVQDEIDRNQNISRRKASEERANSYSDFVSRPVNEFHSDSSVTKGTSNVDKKGETGTKFPTRRVNINNFVKNFDDKKGESENLARSGNSDSRRRVQIKQSSIGVGSSNFEWRQIERKRSAEVKEAKYNARSSPVNDVDDVRAGANRNDVNIPKLNLESDDADGEKKDLYTNYRYKQRIGASNLKQFDLTTRKSVNDREIEILSARENSTKMERDDLFRASTGHMMKGWKTSDEKVVTVKTHDAIPLHTRQGSDPTSQFVGRKLSSVSQDLLRSKEELINRSRECGRMLEQYKQRGEERREQMSSSDKRPEPLPKPTERKSLSRDGSSDSGSMRNSFDDDNKRVGYQKKAFTEKISDNADEQGRNSPKFAKRKSSYIDSWLQSQQSRISTLASAIKEEDSDDDTKIPSMQSDNSSRERTRSMPPNSLLMLSWARSDDSSHDGEEHVHRRSHSGEEIMGIAKVSNLPRYPDVKRHTPRQSPKNRSRSESPRQSDGYSPGDIRLRSLHIQQESQLSRSESLSRKDRRSNSSMSPRDADERRDRFRPVDISSPRSQSERTSPHLQRSFDSAKSVSVGNSPRLRKETTFDSDIVTEVVPSPDATLISPRPIISRRSSAGSDNVTRDQGKYGSLPRSGSPRKTSSPDNYFFGEQGTKYGSLPRSPPPRKTSSPNDVFHSDQGGQQYNSLPRNVSPRRISSETQPIPSQFSPTNSASRKGLSPIAKQPLVSQQQQHSVDLNTPNRSGSEDKFDWPEPPDLDALSAEEDPCNQTWPNASGSSSPFTSRRGHLEGSRNFPVAVVKPLQHEKTQSLDEGKIVANEKSHFQTANLGPMIKNGVREINHGDQTVQCYNLRIEQNISSTLSLDNPRDLSSNSSLEFREKPVDVGYSDRDDQSSLRDLSDAEQAPGISNLITQDFHWYRPGNPHSNAASFDRDDATRDSARESARDSTHERLGRFKRGSKLLSSKYQSFSKSLENLSKVGKDLIKGKKKAGDAKEDRKNGDGKKSAKNRSERKSVVLGDLQLNEEFAMKMEKRSRYSFDLSNDEHFQKRQNTPESRQTPTETWPTGNVARLSRSLNSSDNSGLSEDSGSVGVKRLSEVARNGNEKDAVKLRSSGIQTINQLRRGGRVETEFGVQPVRDSVRRREVKSEYFEAVETAQSYSARPKSEYFDYEDDNSLGSARNSSQGFEEVPDDEDEKEMVKIVRKISGLRSSQVKIKKNVPLEDNPKKMPEEQQKEDSFSSSHNDVALQREDAAIAERKDQDGNVIPDKELQQQQQPQQQQPQQPLDESVTGKPVESGSKHDSNPDPMKRISTSLSRVMTDLRELREQDLTLATQLITLGKSIKHFKQQKKEMDDFYAILNEGDETEEDSDSSDEEEYASHSSGRFTTDF